LISTAVNILGTDNLSRVKRTLGTQIKADHQQKMVLLSGSR